MPSELFLRGVRLAGAGAADDAAAQSGQNFTETPPTGRAQDAGARQSGPNFTKTPPARGAQDAGDAYLERLPAVRALAGQGLAFSQPVTFFMGENGTGKSTLLEAIAAAWGFNPEGGSRNFHFATAETHSGLHRALVLRRGARRPRDGYFLRAESFYNVATEIDRLDEEDPYHLMLRAYGWRSLHEQSHGESFFSLVTNRFGGNGLYILDEPEAALSAMRQLALLSAINELVQKGSQLLIATHSPLLSAYPHAEIYVLDARGATRTPYEQTDAYLLTKRFLEAPERMLRELL